MTFSPLFLNFLEFVTGTGACQQACSPLPKKLSKVSSVNRQRLLTTPCSVTSTSTPIGRRMIEADRLQQNAISRAVKGAAKTCLNPWRASWQPCQPHGQVHVLCTEPQACRRLFQVSAPDAVAIRKAAQVRDSRWRIHDRRLMSAAYS